MVDIHGLSWKTVPLLYPLCFLINKLYTSTHFSVFTNIAEPVLLEWNFKFGTCNQCHCLFDFVCNHFNFCFDFVVFCLLCIFYISRAVLAKLCLLWSELTRLGLVLLVMSCCLYNPVWLDSTFANQQLRMGANVIRFTLYLIKVIITLLTIRTVAVLCVGIPCVITKQNVTFLMWDNLGLHFLSYAAT